MKRTTLLAAFALLLPLCAAQQPPVRVGLLSLYRLPEVTVVPGTKTELAWSGSSSRRVTTPSVIRARKDSIEMGGRSGPSIVITGDFKIISESIRTQALNVPIELFPRDGVLRIIARFPMEDYVAAVLQGETGGDMPPQALKALAVAIRSYATHFRERHQTEGFDFCDSTHCQYLRTETAAAVRSAVLETSGQLLWDHGTPLAAYYHKDCGGRTEAAAVVWPDQRSPALTSRQDPYCVRNAVSWRAEISRADIERALTSASLTVPHAWNRIVIAERSPSGRAHLLKLGRGNTPGVPLSASSLRFALGRTLGWNTLKSDWYDVAGMGDRFVFTGRGVGHGVGLCQTGAAEMAREGKSYRDILAFYYAGAPLGRSAQGIPWKTVSSAAIDVLVVNSEDAAAVQAASRPALDRAAQRSGLTLRLRPRIEVYPSVAMFRDATGEPGWVAASTRGNRVRLEPPSVLGTRLEDVLRHEFLHMAVESNARADTPLWFREGLVVHLTGDTQRSVVRRMSPEQIEDAIQSRRSQAEMENAYAAAAALVMGLEHRWGRAELMRWLHDGLPGDILERSGLRSSDKVPH